jgi:hypothetical protein
MTQNTYQISRGLTWRHVNGDLVVMEPESGHYHLFNTIGGRIWRDLVDQQPPDHIARELAQRYDLEWERAQSDVNAFVATLMRKGLLFSMPSNTERNPHERRCPKETGGH